MANPSGTVTFLFTDIEGSTKMARAHPESWESARARHHAVLRGAIESNHGYVFQVIGDAFCAAFHTAGEALKAAVQAQQGLQMEPWGAVAIRVRMGIHTGEAQAQEGEYHGYLTMSMVQRLMSAGHGGQILISDATEKLLREKVPEDVSLRNMGEHRFKDVPHLVCVFQAVVPGLQNDFPHLKTLDARPNNLPAQLTSFVGREKELVDVKRLLQNAHLLTLIGPGGTGKTRLSVQAASDMLNQYPDGVWLVELAPILDPLLVPRTTAIAIGLRDEPQRPVIDMLCDYLREKRMLILLDNCEHVVDACAQMADRILHAAPNTRILASSREALGIGGEVTFRVPSLGVPDVQHLPSMDALSQYEAVKLFIDRATFAVPSFTVTNENAPSLAQICHRLDGIPLAIELAAAKVRVLPVEQIARRLDDRFKLLTGGSRTALERHQTLRAAIDWSYNLLLPAEQILFRRFAVFVGGWTLEAAESICSDTSIAGEDVLDLLEHLINKSIVTLQKTRYSMLETLRQYANERLVEAGESDNLRDRHLDYFLSLAETAEPHLIRSEQLEWLPILDSDYENLRAALQWALAKESEVPDLRLCKALGKYWIFRCMWREGANWLERALTKPVDPQNNRERAVWLRVLFYDVELAETLDHLERMKVSAERALRLAHEGSNRCDLAVAKFYWGITLYRFGDLKTSLSYLQQSFSELQGLNEPYWEACVSDWLVLVQHNLGDPSHLANALHTVELARNTGERFTLAIVLCRYSIFLRVNEQLNEARTCLEEAEHLSSQVGAGYLISFVEGELARVEREDGNYKKAKPLFLSSYERNSLFGDKLESSQCLWALGLIAMKEGDLHQAQLYLDQAVTFSREFEYSYYLAECLLSLGILFFLKGDPEKYRKSFRESILLAKNLKLVSSHRVSYLASMFVSPYFQMPEITAMILGTVNRIRRQDSVRQTPRMKREFAQADAWARHMLGNEAFEVAFTQGQRSEFGEMLDRVLKAVEETG